ncbi:hypothetical protein J2T57_001395 [Natronocella acetinitrilica]|uniref:Uncharacterized protein n=1 Tax=Natronocella acetinitrilica TaxID=414046 RepID=A0AAE3G4L4_9GAMM|nr:hypothetical protein [Natronocella acetinitrilica]MCP1674293.1 hypothetical protein [Natronocella acetinitrilica]
MEGFWILLMVIAAVGLVGWSTRKRSAGEATRGGGQGGRRAGTTAAGDGARETRRQAALSEKLAPLRHRWRQLREEREAGVRSGELASWYFDAPTDKQLAVIREAGWPLDPRGLTKGMASEVIGMDYPAEEENLEVLRFFRQSTAGATQTTARIAAVELLADANRREQWEARPASKVLRESLRLIGHKAAKGLTEREGRKQLDAFLLDADDEGLERLLLEAFEGAWGDLEDRDVREDLGIRKPTPRQVADVILASARGRSAEELAANPIMTEDVVEALIEQHPSLAR